MIIECESNRFATVCENIRVRSFIVVSNTFEVNFKFTFNFFVSSSIWTSQTIEQGINSDNLQHL